MSGLFEDNESTPKGPRTRQPSRRPRALLPTLLVVVALMVAGSIFIEFWTERLWFASVGFSGVFSTVVWTRVLLFFVFGLLFAGVAVGNVMLAYRVRPLVITAMHRNPTVERYQDTLDPIRKWVLIGLGSMFFIFGGASGASQWKQFLLWRNQVPFGDEDVYFGRDIGFFVFGLPWYNYLLDFGFTLLLVAVIAAATTHYVYGGIRWQVPRDRVSRAAQVQLSVLLGLLMLVRAISYWVDRFGLATSDGHLFTGVSYTDAHAVIPAKNILAIIALICAGLFFANVIRPSWMLPVLGFGLLILSSILIGGLWPTIVQRFQVKPSEPDKEAAYIQRNIEATRDAYGIEGVDIVSYPGESPRTAKELRQAARTVPSVRLIDPRLVAPAFEQLQQMRGFYKMADVLDVDRYVMKGSDEPQDVVIGVRELDLNGLRDNQRNWANDHTVYTHGYGVVAAYGTKRGAQGEPEWAQQNLPSVGELGEFEQRVYYGEFGASYSIVGAPEDAPDIELDIPDSAEGESEPVNTTYEGRGGVPIGSTFNQLLYAAKFWESSIVLSGRVNTESKIIYDRSPRQMVEKAAPWLTVDGDPYPAVVDGRLLWIIDGYTTSANYPMSQRVDLDDATSDTLTTDTGAVAAQTSTQINYIRNSVKATVDAYDGTVDLYAWEEDDPMLKAWRGAFPGVVQSRSEISDDLMAHLRYPEDMFKVQRDLLATYHVTDPKTFYGGAENWKVPEDPTGGAAEPLQPPFFLTVKLPNGESAFSLTSVYVPQSRQNLAGFIAVNADAASEDYGQLTVLELPTDNTVRGPGQMANAFNVDPDVSQALLQYKQQQATALMGNLLTLPVGDDLLYAQPVYTFRGGTGSYPILQFVLVSFGGQVGIGTNFQEALDDALGLTGEEEPEPPGPGPGAEEPPTGTVEEQITEYLANARREFEAAQAALERGDLGAYQAANERGLEWLNRVIALREGPGATAGTTGPTTTGPGATAGTTGPTTAPTITPGG